MNNVVFSRENILLICDGLDQVLSDPNYSKGTRISKTRRIVRNLKEYAEKHLMSKNEFYSKQQELALERDPELLEMINERLEMLKNYDPRTD